MYLNKIRLLKSSKKKRIRVGRGIGSGSGKTCGRGHKGQKSRSGWKNKIGFEGGQTPLQIRLPKFGFTCKKSNYKKEIRLSNLNKINDKIINIKVLKNKHMIKKNITSVKIIKSGKLFNKKRIFSINTSKAVKNLIE